MMPPTKLTYAARQRLSERLLSVSASGPVQELEKLLLAGADVHFGDDAALIEACQKSGSLDVVKCLVSAGAYVRVQNDRPVLAAAQANHWQVVDWLIQEAGADIHAGHGELLRLATRADSSGREETLRRCQRLLEAGADPNQKNGQCLVLAVRYCDQPLIELFSRHHAKFSTTPGLLPTAAVFASSKFLRFFVPLLGSLSKTDALRSYQAVLFDRSKTLPESRLKILRTLRELGVECHSQANLILDAALRSRNENDQKPTLIDVLLGEFQLVPTRPEVLSRTLANYWQPLAVEALLKCREFTEHVKPTQLLLSACENGHLPLVSELVERFHADVNAAKGRALEVAVSKNHFAVLAYLLQRGAEPNLCRENLLSLAIQQRSVDTLTTLLQAGADPSKAKYAAFEQALQVFVRHRDLTYLRAFAETSHVDLKQALWTISKAPYVQSELQKFIQTYWPLARSGLALRSFVELLDDQPTLALVHSGLIATADDVESLLKSSKTSNKASHRL